jgi:branched-chain amino acid transport system ATP-binding protein
MGANGSGKTTLFNIVTGFLTADIGSITFDNQLINSKSPPEISSIGISRTFQDLRLINSLSVRENIQLVIEKGMFHIATLQEFNKVNDILDRVSLLSLSDNFCGNLSYGQQKLLTLGCCLAHDPKLFLLDEPIAGIDNENQEKIKSIVLDLKKEGKTIFQVEHNIRYIEATSDTVLVLDKDGIKVI